MQLTVAGDSLVVDRDHYRTWIETTESRRLPLRIAEAWEYCREHTPVISILLPTYNTPADFLRQALDSVLAQLYPHWQLCIADDASGQALIRPLLEQYAARDARIRLHFQETNRGIAGTSNNALAMATGDYVALLDHDDVLSPHALLSVAAATNRMPRVQLLYSDSDSLDADGQRVEPFFKPGWNYDLLLGQNYLNHLTVYRRQRLLDVGGWREGFEGSQDYDLLLRASEGLADADIHHIPEILYHWRQVPTSVSRANLGAAVRAARTAIREHLQRSGQAAAVKPCAGAVVYNRIEWQPRPGCTAIAVYGEDMAAIERTRQQLRRLDAHLDVHGIHIEEGPADFQALNEWAKRQTADHLGFIAGGLVLESANVLSSLIGQASRPCIAAVSAKLIDSHGKPQGPILLAACADGRIAAVAAYGAAHQRNNSGYIASLVLDRQVPALQAGCLLMKANLFHKAGGWRLPLSDSLLAGIDLSLRLSASGQRLIWNAQAEAHSDSPALDSIIAQAGADATQLLQHQAPAQWLNNNTFAHQVL
jgi:GT2 family glycosyltransferase